MSISQLKESFKEKIKSTEDWPERLSIELNIERERNNKTIEKLENDLKQNFQIVCRKFLSIIYL